MKINGYKTCQSCEQLSLEINYLRDVDMRALEQDIQYACKIISDLLDLLYDTTLIRNGADLSDAERFYREHHIKADELGSMENNYIDDDLPF